MCRYLYTVVYAQLVKHTSESICIYESTQAFLVMYRYIHVHVYIFGVYM